MGCFAAQSRAKKKNRKTHGTTRLLLDTEALTANLPPGFLKKILCLSSHRSSLPGRRSCLKN